MRVGYWGWGPGGGMLGCNASLGVGCWGPYVVGGMVAILL